MNGSDSIDDILNYYSTNQESQRHQTQQLEFAIMEKVIQTYLSQKPLKILEIGAGAGYYTQKLAQMGHQVVAVEPVPVLIQQNEESCRKLSLENQVRWVQCDARNLTNHLDEKFDLIMNMGPFYHLTKAEDRLTVLDQSHQLLDEQGLMMSVFLSRVGYLSYVLAHQPEAVAYDPDGFKNIMMEGHDKSHPRDGTFRGYFSELDELAPFHQSKGFKIQKLHVLDPCIGGLDDVFNRLSDDLKQVWVDILFAFSQDPHYWNTGRTWLVLATR